MATASTAGCSSMGAVCRVRLEEHHRVEAGAAGVAIEAGRQPPHAGEVHHRGHAAQQVVLGDLRLQRKAMEELRGKLLAAQHPGPPPTGAGHRTYPSTPTG